jgi:hypothetical protein
MAENRVSYVKTILYLIIILVYEEIQNRDRDSTFLIQQIVQITINNYFLFCDDPHNTNRIREKQIFIYGVMCSLI